MSTLSFSLDGQRVRFLLLWFIDPGRRRVRRRLRMMPHEAFGMHSISDREHAGEGVLNGGRAAVVNGVCIPMPE